MIGTFGIYSRIYLDPLLYTDFFVVFDFSVISNVFLQILLLFVRLSHEDQRMQAG